MRTKNKILNALVGCFSLSLILFVQAKAQQPIIDMHLHADQPPGAISQGDPGPCRPEPCIQQGSATSGPMETLSETLEIMDKHNIVKGFLSGIDPSVLAEWNKAAPGRFINAPFIFDPAHMDFNMIKQAFEEGKFQGMGEIATELNGMAPNDPKLEPYFALAEKMDVPVLLHCAAIGPYLPSFRSRAGHPSLIEDVVVKHPGLRIYVENCGYPYLDEMVGLMSQYPQVYGDLSTITWVIPRTAFHDYVKGLVRAGLGKRLMFGSDQMRWPEMIEKGIEAIQEADYLTEDQKRDILYNNAARFLRLESN
jgi:predicted TIM-barrel fold metal-dependent hydrolase